MGSGKVTDTRSVGVITPDADIPPPPDGSGIIAAPATGTSQDDTAIPPPPDGSGMAPDTPQYTAGGDTPTLVQADRLGAEDEAALRQLYQHGTVDQIAAFLHQRGRTSDPAALADYVAKRDSGKPVTDVPNYEGKPVETTGLGAFARGADQGLTLGLGDEAHGFLNGVTSLLGGGSYTDAYNKTVDSDRALLGQDSQQHGLASIAGNLAGGAVLPFGLAKAGLTPALETVALKAGQEAVAAGASADAAKVIAARAVARRMAVEGGAYGAAYGGGSAEGGPDQRALGAVEGGAVGAAGGALLGGLGVRTAGKTPIASGATDVADAAARQGIDLLPADVSGPTIRRLTGAAAQAPLSASPIINAAKRVLAQGQAAVSRQAPNAVEASTAGEAARSGAEAYIKRTSGIGGALYDRAAQRAGDAMIDPVKARQVLDDQIARLQAVPGGGQGLEETQAMRDALNGQFSVQGIRDMRTEHFVDPALRGGPVDTRMKQVINAAAQDVEDGLRAQGKDSAADAFKTADRFWRDRLDTIDNVIAPIIGQPGQKGGQAISKAIDTAAKGDLVKAQRFLGTLPTAERQVVSSSFIERLGRATRGQQNAEGHAFSLSTFLSNWSDLSPRARAALFTPEQRAALQDVATVANGVREASKYANHSNTSGGIWGNLGGLIGVGSVAPHAAAGGLATQLVGGKLLASPRFARWLARAPRTSLSDTSYIERLGRIARAEPGIASEALGLQQHLLSAVRSSPNRAAADEPGNDMGGAYGNSAQQQPAYQSAQP